MRVKEVEKSRSSKLESVLKVMYAATQLPSLLFGLSLDMIIGSMLHHTTTPAMMSGEQKEEAKWDTYLRRKLPA